MEERTRSSKCKTFKVSGSLKEKKVTKDPDNDRNAWKS